MCINFVYILRQLHITDYKRYKNLIEAIKFQKLEFEI